MTPRKVTPLAPPARRSSPGERRERPERRDRREHERALGTARPRGEGSVAPSRGEERPGRPAERVAARPRGDLAGGDRPPKRTEKRTRDPRDTKVWRTFRISWGERHGADTRRLLAMLCRRGEIGSGDIGTIRVHATYSIADVAADVADAFAARAMQPDPRDPRVKITPEVPAPPPSKRAPRA